MSNILVVKSIKKTHIVDKTGEHDVYELKAEVKSGSSDSGMRVTITQNKEFKGFAPKQDVSLELFNPQTTL